MCRPPAGVQREHGRFEFQFTRARKSEHFASDIKCEYTKSLDSAVAGIPAEHPTSQNQRTAYEHERTSAQTNTTPPPHLPPQPVLQNVC